MRVGWKTIKSQIVYHNPWFRVREDAVKRPDGKRGIYGIVERPHVNFVIAQIKNKILFINEYRYPIKKIILQLPAGTTNVNEGDLHAAQRELLQETGYRAKIWKKYGSFFIAPGHESIQANLFVASNCTEAKKRTTPSNEVINKIQLIPLTKIKKLIALNKIQCGISLACLNIFFQKNERP
ncbi:NUDIX hydrolase [Candidatus Parcubacteria bacterium]|jgi:ADP-ribose pyrophosphatase|nr:MAG: NUDIX hydrolase [Candidatus Parcubacteria bacterium]